AAAGSGTAEPQSREESAMKADRRPSCATAAIVRRNQITARNGCRRRPPANAEGARRAVQRTGARQTIAVTTPSHVLTCAATGVTTAATSVDAADATTHCSRLDGFRMTA